MRHQRAWRVFILAASYVFYAWWDWRFVFLLAASTVVNQALAVAIYRTQAQRARKALLALAVAFDLGLLAYFKYAGFFLSSADNVARDSRGSSNVTLPVGISFFTFMAISYVVDTYRGELVPGVVRALRGVPGVLPASRRRPDRARERAAAAARDAARPAPGRHLARVLPDRHRALPEGRDREPPGDAHRRRGLRGAEPPLVARGARRRLRLRRPDLRRLLRLHEHRDRHRAAARLRVPAELQLAVRRRLAPGLLAALAHDALALAARLPVHPARRQPEGHGSSRTGT